MIVEVAALAGVVGMIGAYFVGRNRIPEEAKARIAAVETERDQYKAIAAKHEVTWNWPEGPATRWEVVPELADRSYDMTLDANLQALAKDLGRLPPDQHVELDVHTWVIGAWKWALTEAGWRFPREDHRVWDEDVRLHRTFRGPPVEVQKELLEWFKDTTWGLYHKRDDGKFAWRRPADPIRLVVDVKRRVIEAPPPRPEIRFVEVPVAVSVAVPAGAPVSVTEEDRLRLAAMVEVEVAEALARHRLAPIPSEAETRDRVRMGEEMAARPPLPSSALDAPPAPSIPSRAAGRT